MKNTNDKTKMSELAKANQPTPEVMADWEKMAQAAVDNLNRNVEKEMAENENKPE